MNQEVALGILLSGKSVFLTGPAGAGKTFVLNEFIRRAKREGLSVAKTATTGLAATHLSGNTIHAWSGIGINRTIPYRFFDKLSKTRRETINRADVLIIDEISMMHDYMLDMVNEICKVVRENDDAFGGLQVVLAGDFAQLPPVNRADDEIQGGFAYLSQAWQELDPVICYLSTQYRQEDAEFLEILNAIRSSDVRRRHAEALLGRVGAEISGEAYTELHTTNFNVDRVNERRLADIHEEEMTYEMTHTGAEGKVMSLKRSVLAPELLRLKLGATVMALKNDQSGRFVNGSVGTVIGFEEGTNYPYVEFNNGRTVAVGYDTWEMRDGERKVAGVTQIPLRLAWAITVHKSQGMTLDGAVLNLRRAFAPGMGYVALSRVKSLNAMSLVGIGKSALLVAPEAVKMNQIWERKSRKAAKEYADLAVEIGEDVKRGERKGGSKKGGDGKKNGGRGTRKSLTDEEKAEKEARSKAWKEKLARMRESYPKAFMEWTIEDDLELQDLVVAGRAVSEITGVVGRHPGSVRARIKKNWPELLE
ncbi:AAA family ATPase [Candidatus Saccharibacteria bacterium]|nr:AAA family ATPase [Candidatus Saccharibacteria bacterium]